MWLSPEDIEAMMEEELHRGKLYPTIEEPVVDVERFIARHLRVQLDEHAELERDVLGLTEFFPDKQPRILINRGMTNAVDGDDPPPGLRGRWRATFAHEACHVVMHKVLFQVASGQEPLFRMERTEGRQLMRCLKKNVLFRAGGSDWREVQANMGMASLLMPGPVFRSLASKLVADMSIRTERLVSGSPDVVALVGELAQRVEVSKQAAAIRLETLGLVSPRGQTTLSGLRCPLFWCRC